MVVPSTASSVTIGRGHAVLSRSTKIRIPWSHTGQRSTDAVKAATCHASVVSARQFVAVLALQLPLVSGVGVEQTEWR